MASLLETWRAAAYGEDVGRKQQEQLWQTYFSLEKGFYEKVLSDPAKVYTGTVKGLADEFGIDVFYFTGILDGIDESLKDGYHNPLDSMTEETEVKLEIEPEKLYYNMVEAKANWLYELEQWNAILPEERRKELYKQQKKDSIVRHEGPKVYPNDPCPCGSGKKYKKCCMKKEQPGA